MHSSLYMVVKSRCHSNTTNNKIFNYPKNRHRKINIEICIRNKSSAYLQSPPKEFQFHFLISEIHSTLATKRDRIRLIELRSTQSQIKAQTF